MQVNLCPDKPPHVPVEEIHVRGDGVDAVVTEEKFTAQSEQRVRSSADGYVCAMGKFVMHQWGVQKALK